MAFLRSVEPLDAPRGWTGRAFPALLSFMPSEEPVRPWAAGIGLILLGLFVATVANVVGVSAPGASAPVRVVGGLGYAAGIGLCGAGMHRLIWYRSTRRPRWFRLLVTVLVTPPVFAVTGIVVGTLMTLFQMRLLP